MNEDVVVFIIELIVEALRADIMVDSEYCVKSGGSDEDALPNLKKRTQRLHELSGISFDDLEHRIEQRRHELI